MKKFWNSFENSVTLENKCCLKIFGPVSKQCNLGALLYSNIRNLSAKYRVILSDFRQNYVLQFCFQSMACLYQKLEVKCILKANCASSLEPCKNLVFSCCHNLAVLATSQSVLKIFTKNQCIKEIKLKNIITVAQVSPEILTQGKNQTFWETILNILEF